MNDLEKIYCKENLEKTLKKHRQICRLQACSKITLSLIMALTEKDLDKEYLRFNFVKKKMT